MQSPDSLIVLHCRDLIRTIVMGDLSSLRQSRFCGDMWRARHLIFILCKASSPEEASSCCGQASAGHQSQEPGKNFRFHDGFLWRARCFATIDHNAQEPWRRVVAEPALS